MPLLQKSSFDCQFTHVDVVEYGKNELYGWVRCAIDENLSFNLSRMESYFFKRREPVIHDAFVVAAAIEFCDMTRHRPDNGWGRHFSLRIPVHDPDRWSQKLVTECLRNAIEFLTGDHWDLSFYPRKRPVMQPLQDPLNLRCDISAVVPFSNGLDSRIAAGLAAKELENRIVRIRLGTKKTSPNGIDPCRDYFTAVPYCVRHGKKRFCESSARSRAFKFLLAAGIAAVLSDAERVIMPENGQGALGPCLVPVGQVSPDYRNHPRFGRMMEKFLHALIGFKGRFDYSHIWNTKGEMLALLIKETDNRTNWANTRSCWQQNRQVGVGGKARQCGICTACLLRRLSIHAAGQIEPPNTYVWENLSAPTFNAGATPDFDKAKITDAMEQHAIAGTLYLDHFATLLNLRLNAPRLKLESFRLSQSLEMPQDIVKKMLERLIAQHKTEWENFMAFLGPKSFLVNWIHGERP